MTSRSPAVVELTLGEAPGGDAHVLRTPLQWTVPSGAHVRRGDPVAYAQLDVFTSEKGPPIFVEERRDLHVTFTAPVDGELQVGAPPTGGWTRFRPTTPWRDEVVASLAVDASTVTPGGGLRLGRRFTAGRRVNGMSEQQGSVLSGWYDRARVWWETGGHPSSDTAAMTTLMSLGICELLGIVRGERLDFSEIAADLGGSGHVTFVSDDLLVPSAPVLLAQLRRTVGEARAITNAFTAELADAGFLIPGDADSLLTAPPPLSADALGLVCWLKALLTPSPLIETPPTLLGGRVQPTAAPRFVLLSLWSEEPHLFRHKKLGFPLSLHRFRLFEATPKLRSFLRSDFELIRRTDAQVRDDLVALIDAIGVTTGARVLILNRASSGVVPGPDCYGHFEPPFDVATMAAERNLLLYDVAASRPQVSVVDVDAIVAERGAKELMPDLLHQTAALQTAIRAEIVHIVHTLETLEGR